MINHDNQSRNLGSVIKQMEIVMHQRKTISINADLVNRRIKD